MDRRGKRERGDLDDPNKCLVFGLIIPFIGFHIGSIRQGASSV